MRKKKGSIAACWWSFLRRRSRSFGCHRDISQAWEISSFTVLWTRGLSPSHCWHLDTGSNTWSCHLPSCLIFFEFYVLFFFVKKQSKKNKIMQQMIKSYPCLKGVRRDLIGPFLTQMININIMFVDATSLIAATHINTTHYYTVHWLILSASCDSHTRISSLQRCEKTNSSHLVSNCFKCLYLYIIITALPLFHIHIHTHHPAVSPPHKCCSFWMHTSDNDAPPHRHYTVLRLCVAAGIFRQESSCFFLRETL